MRNIVLVGFMGTGKTRIAKMLAERLDMKYVSTDDFIEHREKMSISEIFAKKGEDYFREVEKDVVREVSLDKGTVIDAGGGVVLKTENVTNLKKSGTLICLWAEPEIILERTKKYKHRPLLADVKNPLERIKTLLEARRPFYERADYQVHTSRMSPEEIAQEIEGMVKNA